MSNCEKVSSIPSNWWECALSAPPMAFGLQTGWSNAPIAAAMSKKDAAGESLPAAEYSIVSGDGLRFCTTGCAAAFTIEAHDAEGRRKTTGGDAFFV